MNADIRPPNEPWQELRPCEPLAGYITYYISDDLSPLPIRGVTLPGNNKSDPNLETGTYGLFSTCAHGMRASIVKRRLGYIIFLTRWQGHRIVTGYYRLRWYAPGSLSNRKPPDYALAADELRFVYPGIQPTALPDDVASVVGARFRISKLVEAPAAAVLIDELRQRPDRTGDYLKEIERLEAFNRYHTGYRYVSWKQMHSFNWEMAAQYLIHDNRGETLPTSIATSSPTGLWRCVACGKQVSNKALLKRCPECGALAALVAVELETIDEAAHQRVEV